jgi:hypothetical protein
MAHIPPISGNFLIDADITYLEKDLLNTEQQLKVVPASFYEKIPQKDLSMFCHKYGFYCLPTVELCEWLKEQIGDQSAIEIGAGHGAVGKYLGIPCTDSRLQEDEFIRFTYKMLGQPVVEYPNHVIKMDAIKAIEHYKPEVVIATWVTQLHLDDSDIGNSNMYGIEEEKIVERAKYIHVGHRNVHGKKRILQREHNEYTFPWLYSRSLDSGSQFISVWE